MAASVVQALGWFPDGDVITKTRDASLYVAAAGYDGEDRISALGDHLLRRIVSRLPVKDAARTAALASRWRHLWRCTPLVMYDAHLLPASVAAVARILADHPGPFRTVSVAHCDFASREHRELAGWPRLLAAKGVQDLVLVNKPADYQHLPNLPAGILLCASLRRLFLGFWRFPNTGAGPSIGFPHLQELSVFGTDMAGRDLDHLLASSPVLDTLALILSRSCERIHLRSRSLNRVLLWHCFVDEVVVDSPLLERLILWRTSVGEDDAVAVRVKIDRAPKLRVLGYLEPRVHRLQIGQNVIKPDTKASPSTVVPSVTTLALKVNFGVLEEVKMLNSILRCFPNVDTLHIESVIAADDKATGRFPAKFWEEAHPIKCVKSQVRKMIIHEFRGEQSEIDFLRFVGRRAEKLRALVGVITKEMVASAYKVNEVIAKAVALSRGRFACNGSVLVVGPRVENCWSFRRASDPSVNDPFD
ncbi:unnamed protein product [Alopecurus aequalis]